MNIQLIAFSGEDLYAKMRLFAEHPSTHETYINVARMGVQGFCECRGITIDHEVMEQVTHPNLLSIVIGPNTNYPQLLTIIGRKFIEDYNFALKQKYQDRVA